MTSSTTSPPPSGDSTTAERPRVPFSYLDRQFADLEPYLRDIEAFVRTGDFTLGAALEQFERRFAEVCAAPFAIGVGTGTDGLALALRAVGVEPGDEVITTPFSFIASANCIVHAGATPVFVDIDPRSLNLDPEKVDAAVTPRTKAILAVEVFGNTTHMDRLAQIARHHELTLIEDACEAIGGNHRGTPVGALGRAGVFGFYQNKQITTGEGGMIVTDDDHLADLARTMRNQGRPPQDAASKNDESRVKSWLRHMCLGYNYRLSEMACALGIVQMERLDQILDARRRIAAMYVQRLMDWQDLILPTVPNPSETSWFVFVVRLSDQYSQVERDRMIQGMHRHEIGAGNYFPCIHLQPFYREQFGCKNGDFPVAESVSTRTIALPFFNRMDETQVELVCHTLKVMLQREQLLKR